MAEAEDSGPTGNVGEGVAATGTPEAPEVIRSWDCSAVASMLLAEPVDLLDVLDPSKAWGRPVTAGAIEADDAALGPQAEGRALPEWWSGTMVRTVRLSVRHGGSQVGFCECAVVRRVKAAEHRACRICFEEDVELLDGCACRGTMRFICKDCLVEQWSTRAKLEGDPSKALRCSLCHQDFTGKALEVLTKKVHSAVQKHKDDFPMPSPAEQETRYKMEIANATQLWQQGNHAEAEASFRKTLPALEGIRGPQDPILLTAQHNFGLLLHSLGQFQEAASYVGRARLGFSKLYGAEHLLTLKALHNEGLVAQVRGRLTEARRDYDVVLEARRRILGPDSLDTLKTSCNLGLVLLHLGERDEAEVLLRSTLSDMERVIGRRHPLALVALQNLSLALAERTPPPLEAEALAREALEGKQRAQGPEHPETLQGWRDLAIVLAKSGREEEAEQALHQTLAGMQKVLGFAHPTTVMVMQKLVLLLRERGNGAAAEELLAAQERGTPARGAGELPAPVPEGELVVALLSLYVAPSYRKQGLGRAMVEHCRALACELHAQALEAHVPVGLSEARAFFERCRFQEEASKEAKPCERVHLQLQLCGNPALG